MKLEFLMSYEASLSPNQQPIGKGPYGERMIAEVTGGTFEGPRLKGEVLTCGGDWILIDADGFGHLDVRATFKTHDGAHIYVQYPGVLEMNEKVASALASGDGTELGDSYFMTQPRFETGDERYAWLNRLVTVGQGRIVPGGVAYEVFACLND
jgi:hypothetical protein